VALAVLAERLECGAAEVAAIVDTLEAKGLPEPRRG
jgi:DNA-binding MarR family transcriptional regulator